MTPAQQAALARLRHEAVIYAWDGVSIATARRLVELGLAKWAPEPHMVTTYGLTGRRRYQTEWGIRLPARWE